MLNHLDEVSDLELAYARSLSLSEASGSPATSPPLTSQPSISRKPRIRKREAGHIPRPRNAFIIFRSKFWEEMQRDPIMMEDGDARDHRVVSCKAGRAWNKLSPDEKAPFVALAVEERIRHAQKFPAYRYSPNKLPTARKTIPGGPRISSPSKRRLPEVISVRHQWISESPHEVVNNSEEDVAEVEQVLLPPTDQELSLYNKGMALVDSVCHMEDSHNSVADAAEIEQLILSSSDPALSPSAFFSEFIHDPFVPTSEIPPFDLDSGEAFRTVCFLSSAQKTYKSIFIRTIRIRISMKPNPRPTATSTLSSESSPP
jgi:hypothetical protein